MFERYTERARRVIFFARYEATRYGSRTIELEHLVLGLLREDPNIVERFSAQQPAEVLRGIVGKDLQVRGGVPASIDLPLSDSCRKVLAHAREEADALNHRFIGTEHLLLGVLGQTDSHCASALKNAGLDAVAIREQLAREPQAPPSPVFVEPPPATRDEVRAVIDKLPEARLGWAKQALETLGQAPSMAPGFLRATFAGGSARQPAQPAEPIAEGRISTSRIEDGWRVVDTQHLLKGHNLQTTERLRISEDGRSLSYSHEVEGPDRQRHRQSWDFEIFSK